MSYTRRKFVSLDGAELVIAPLTVDQVEVVNAPLSPEEEKRAAVLAHPDVFRIYELVCCGLNNAAAVASEASTPWTPERIENQLDLVLIRFLQTEIMDFSGLKIVSDAPGESSAAAPAI